MRRRGGRGSSSTIATVFILALTIVAGTVLWAYKPPIPPQPATLEYYVQGGQSQETWGDGSDCTSTAGVESCLSLAALNIVLTSWTPSVVSVASVTFLLICNGTVYLTASLADMAIVPGSNVNPGPTSPQLGHCGSFVPPAAAFNRLAFFDQLSPGAKNLAPGDQIVLFEPFQPPNCPKPQYTAGVLTSCDDDFHGAPGWCFTQVGACQVEFLFAGPPQAVVTTVPLFGAS